MQCPLTITGVMHWPLALGDTNLETPLLTTVVTPSKSKSEWQWHEISRFRGYWFQIVTQWCDIMWHSDVRRVWMSNMPAAFYSFCSSFTVSWVWATADSEHRPPQRFSILWQKTESWLASWHCSEFKHSSRSRSGSRSRTEICILLQPTWNWLPTHLVSPSPQFEKFVSRMFLTDIF